jgi:hypothetical protein
VEADILADPDFMDEMMSGRYDVACPTCKGLRVVDGSPEAEDEREFDREWAAEIRHERLMLGERY